MQTKNNRETSALERISLKLTEWVGTTTSVVLHTIFFIGIFTLRYVGFTVADVLLILTTAVSLEAIYLAIFIQMTINRNTESLKEVEEDVDEIQKDVDEIQEDVDEIQRDVDEIQDDVQNIEVDVDDISKDIDEIQDVKAPKVVEKQPQVPLHKLIAEMSTQLTSIQAELKKLQDKERV